MQLMEYMQLSNGEALKLAAVNPSRKQLGKSCQIKVNRLSITLEHMNLESFTSFYLLLVISKVRT